MATKITTTIDRSGPFFRQDPVKTFRQNVRVMMAAVVAEGQSDVRAQLDSGEGSRAPISNGMQPARVSAHVIGRTRSLQGKQWAVTGVVSVNNSGFSRKQGIALMAAASLLERRTHAFRRTASRVRSMRSANMDELLKGLQ